MGKLQWVQGQVLVQMSYFINMLAKRLTKPRLKDAVMCNKVILKAQEMPRPLWYMYFPLERGLAVIAIADATNKGNEDLSSQGGVLLCLGPEEACTGDHLHLIDWGSKTIERAHRSAPSSELANISAATDAADLLKFQAGFLDRRISRVTFLKTDSEGNLNLLLGTGVPSEANLLMDCVSIRQRIATGVWQGRPKNRKRT